MGEFVKFVQFRPTNIFASGFMAELEYLNDSEITIFGCVNGIQ